MTLFSLYGQRLWHMLPAVYRETDQHGHLARYLDSFGALLDRVAETLEQRERDIAPDQSQAWLIPYFADLLDVRLVSPHVQGRRAEVDRAVAWRKRKGTAAAVEAITEALLGREMELREGLDLVAVTPRIDAPLRPARLFGQASPNRRNPALAARHPGLPVATLDFRQVSRALRSNASHPAAKSSMFPRRNADGDLLPEAPEKLAWRQANVHGVPSFPGSFDDLAARTPDLRSPGWKVGHAHPKRVVLYTRPPEGFFDDPIGWRFSSLEELTPLLVGGTVTYRPPPPVNRATTKRGVHEVRLVAGPGDTAVRLEDLNIDGTLRIDLASDGPPITEIELVRCAIRNIIVSSAPAGLRLVARDCWLSQLSAMRHDVVLEYCSIQGNVQANRLWASDSLFVGRILGEGAGASTVACLRYCRIDPTDDELLRTTRRHRVHQESLTSAVPLFWSSRPHEVNLDDYSRAGAGVLHPECPAAIRFGAEDGGELGAYHHRFHVLRERALLDKLRDFLPVGMTPALVPDTRLQWSPPQRAKVEIEIDATALQPPQEIWLADRPPQSSQHPLRARLELGEAYRLHHRRGGIDFSIDLDGSVQVDVAASTANVASVSDGVLTVHGVETIVDTRDLDVPFVAFANLTGQQESSRFLFRLLPGEYRLYYPTGAGQPSLDYTVHVDGSIAVDPGAVDHGVARVAGRVLTVTGVEIEVEAQALSATRLLFPGLEATSAQGGFSLRVLPGDHRVEYVAGGRPRLDFRVQVGGAVELDPNVSASHVASVSGNRLTLHGVALTVDASALEYENLSFYGLLPLVHEGEPGVYDVAVLPGPHRIRYGAGAGYPAIDFAVRLDGNVDLKPAVTDHNIAAFADGRLVVRGIPVKVDRRDLSAERVTFAGVRSIEGESSTDTLRLLPGRHRAHYVSAGGHARGAAYADFLVEPNGQVVPTGPALRFEDGVLALVGLTIAIDNKLSVAASAPPSLNRVGPLKAGHNEVRLLPGPHRILYLPRVRNETCYADFVVLDNGTVQVEPDHQSVLAALGTALDVRGLTIELDTTQMSEPTLVGWLRVEPGQVSEELTLLSGKHALRYTADTRVHAIEIDVVPDESGPSPRLVYWPAFEIILNAGGGHRLALRPPKLAVATSPVAGEAFRVRFSGASPNLAAWIGLYAHGHPGGFQGYRDRRWTTGGTQPGSAPFPDDGEIELTEPNAGRYELRLQFQAPGELQWITVAVSDVTVVPSGA